MATTNAGPLTYNHDVAGLYRRINRFIVEILKSVSSGGSQVNTFDQTRLQSYIGAIRAYQNWVMAQPQLDLPETHPRVIQLEPAPSIPEEVENESVRDVVYMLELARDELVNGQTSRNPSGMVSFDAARLTAVVDKVEALLVSYVQTVTPLDLPESSPSRVLSTSGLTGV